MQLHELGAAAAVRAMRGGEFSPVDLVRALLDRIAATEDRVLAWETVDADGALAAARDLESERRRGTPAGPLFGLPVGIKDIFHARGLPTVANFEPYRARPVAREDSGAVGHLRDAGAIVLGKTVTVQHASGNTSPKTRNPWNSECTPGGSSSGSGASVAARQVPAAMGTQTGGSTLRPAAYCGIVGLKPTFGRISRYGLQPDSWSLDHAGILVRSVEDAALVLQAVARHDPRDPYSVRQAPEDYVGAARATGAPPRLGLCMELMEMAEPPVRAAAEEAARRLAEAGAEIREVRLPVPMALLQAMQQTISDAEMAAVHSEQYSRLAEHYTPRLRAALEVGQLIPAAVHLHALRLRGRLRGPMIEFVGGLDAVLGPTAPNLPGPPSAGTGDARAQRIWTLFGFPNVSLPTGLGAEGLPHAVQVVGSHFGERALLRVAAWCEAVFGPMPAPF